jgi:ubiquinone/menaquinone biosynthesis C-methylase UbiE
MPTITEPAKVRAATTYNAASDHFDDEPLGFWERHGERTVARLALRPGADVLDVGCGTGASALPAARRVGPAGKVVGIDLAERLLEIARRKAANRNLDNVEFRFGDMEHLGYPDQHFDAVICVFAIFFVPDMAKQLRELWRMVRPGGQLAITTWGPRVLEPGAGIFWSAVKGITARPLPRVQPMGPDHRTRALAGPLGRSRHSQRRHRRRGRQAGPAVARGLVDDRGWIRVPLDRRSDGSGDGRPLTRRKSRGDTLSGHYFCRNQRYLRGGPEDTDMISAG